MSDNCRQRYNIATGGGLAKPAPGKGAHPKFAQGGQVGTYGKGGGVSHKSCPPGFKKMNRGGKS